MPDQQPGRSKGMLACYVGAALILALVGLGVWMWRPLRILHWERTSETGKMVLIRFEMYVTGQTIYITRDWNHDGRLQYAHPFSLLREEPDGDGDALSLIDEAFACCTAEPDSPPATGYYYADCETIRGAPIDWEQDFALCAFPAGYERTGYRVFIIKTDGVLWAKDLGKAEAVRDFPADPAKEGWQMIRDFKDEMTAAQEKPLSHWGLKEPHQASKAEEHVNHKGEVP